MYNIDLDSEISKFKWSSDWGTAGLIECHSSGVIPLEE